jgi:hypothetical protein
VGRGISGSAVRIGELSADTSVISGFDKDARPIVYMRPRHENTETSPRQIRHLIYVL